MLQLRAKQIIEEAKSRATVGPWSDQLSKSMTHFERDFIKKVWNMLPGTSCFVDALEHVADGIIPPPENNCSTRKAIEGGAELSLQSFISGNKYYLAYMDYKFYVIIFESRFQKQDQQRLDWLIITQDKEFKNEVSNSKIPWSNKH